MTHTTQPASAAAYREASAPPDLCLAAELTDTEYLDTEEIEEWLSRDEFGRTPAERREAQAVNARMAEFYGG